MSQKPSSRFFDLGFVSLISITAYIFFIIASQSTSAFIDVKENHQHFTAIVFLEEYDILQGDGVTNGYEPGRTLNRAEWAAVLVRLSRENPSVTQYNNCFPDVTDDWFAPYVCFAKERGLVQGFQAGELTGMYGPNEPLRYGEILVTMARIANWNVSFGEEKWYGPAMVFAEQRNILRNRRFDDLVRRDVMAEIIFRSFAVKALQIGSYGNDTAAKTLEYVAENPDFILSEILQGKPERGTREQETRTMEDEFEIMFSELTKENVVANGVDSYTVQFRLSNEKGQHLDDRTPGLSVYLEGSEYSFDDDGSTEDEFLSYTNLGAGFYNTVVTSTRSGIRNLIIHDLETGHMFRKALYFSPGKAAIFEITAEKDLTEDNVPLNEKHYTLEAFDALYNPIPDAVFSGTTSLGELFIQQRSTGVASAILRADQYGEAAVEFNASAGDQIFTERDTVSFSPIGIGSVPSLPSTAEADVTIPLHVFIPNNLDQVESMQITIEVPGSLSVIAVDITNNSFIGGVETATGERGSEIITVEGFLEGNEANRFSGQVGEIIVGALYPQEHIITGGMRLNVENTAVIPQMLHTNNSLSVAADTISTDMNQILATPNGKWERRVCMDVFIAPNTDVTAAQVLADVSMAEEMLYHNSAQNSCPYFVGIDAEVHDVYESTWKKMFGAGEDENQAPVSTAGVLQWYADSKLFTEDPDAAAEAGIIDPAFVKRENCTTVFYVNGQLRTAGKSVRSPVFFDEANNDMYGVSPYIIIDNTKDSDDMALARQLVHHLSGNMVYDFNQGTFQGARYNGNLMNMDEIGENQAIITEMSGQGLTPVQCEAIEWTHTRYNKYPPDQGPTI